MQSQQKIISNSKCAWEGGKFCIGRLPPKVQPPILYYTILTEKELLSYTFCLDKKSLFYTLFYILFPENKAQVNNNNYGTFFMSKKVRLPKIRSFLRKMKFGPKSYIIMPFFAWKLYKANWPKTEGCRLPTSNVFLMIAKNVSPCPGRRVLEGWIFNWLVHNKANKPNHKWNYSKCVFCEHH